MSMWKEYKLGEIAEVQTGPFGSLLHAADYVEEGIPSIMPTNIGNRLNILMDGIVHINEGDLNRLQKYTVREGDIVYSRRGDVEKCAFITDRQVGWLCGTGCLRIRFTSEQIFPKFCAYYLNTTEARNWILGNAVGTTMPNLNTTILESLPLIIPSFNEQVVIAEILSSLDDKIDLLQLQNKTLEQMAETLFRQWFVEEAEEGWKKVNYGYFVTPKRGQNLTRAEIIEGEYPVVAAGLAPSGYHNKTNTLEGVVTISSSGANAGFVRFYDTAIWASDCSYIDKTITPFLYFSYVFLKLNQVLLFDKQEGSAQPHIYPSHIMDLEMLDYPLFKIEEYEVQVTDYFLKIKSNNQQIRLLTTQRDVLLPKLMSGEVVIISN